MKKVLEAIISLAFHFETLGWAHWTLGVVGTGRVASSSTLSAAPPCSYRERLAASRQADGGGCAPRVWPVAGAHHRRVIDTR